MHFFWRKKKYQVWGIELTNKEWWEFRLRFLRSRMNLKLNIFLVLNACFAVLISAEYLDFVADPWIDYFSGRHAGVAAVSNPLPSVLQFVFLVLFVVALLGPMAAATWYLSKRLPRHQRSVLREMGFAVCVECGYDLTGVTGEDSVIERCAECGAALGGMVGVGERGNERE